MHILGGRMTMAKIGSFSKKWGWSNDHVFYGISKIDSYIICITETIYGKLRIEI
jgi:hypothetical protein